VLATCLGRVTTASGITVRTPRLGRVGFRVLVLGFSAFFVAPRPLDAQSLDLSRVLREVGAYVETYLTRVQSIVGTEKVIIQPVARDWTPDGMPRTLLYDLRLDWSPGSAAAVKRDLVAVNGRIPKPSDQPKCTDNAALTPEALELLLPVNQREFVFTDAGTARVDGRVARVLAFQTRHHSPPSATWKDGCGIFDPGAVRGRIWVGVESAEVYRLESGLPGLREVRVPRDQPWAERARNITFERLDTSISYRPFRFADPEEVILLPATIESLNVVRNATSLRVRHEYTGYRRFVTGGRIVN
jgi:hypothetical protein